MAVFTKNIMITFFVRVLTVSLGIGISVIIARTLGPEGQGIYSLTILFPTLLVLFTGFGINSATTYFVGKKKYSTKEIFGNNIILSILISAFSILIGLIIISFFSNQLFPEVPNKYLILALGLIPFSVFFNFIINILLGLQKIKRYNLVKLFEPLFFFLLMIIFFIFFYPKIDFAILAQILSFALTVLILFLLVKKEVGGIICKNNKHYLKNTFSYGFKTYLGSIFVFLHHKIDIFLVNIFVNPMAAGFYFIAVKLAEMIWHFSQSVTTILFPKVASERSEKQLKEFTPLVCRNVLFVSFLTVIFLFIFKKWLITLFYTKTFLDSVQPFQILLIGVLAYSGLRILNSDLMGRGKPMPNTYISGFSIILNIVLNIALIPRFGITGAAWATAVSYSLAFFIMLLVYSKISNNKIRDVIFVKKSDFKFYKEFLVLLKTKYLSSNENI